jgi:hypothetical protein
MNFSGTRNAKNALKNQFNKNHKEAENRIKARYNASPERVAEAENKSQKKAIQYEKNKEKLQDQINYAFERPTKESHFQYTPLSAIEWYAGQDIEFAPELVKMAREALIKLPYEGRYINIYKERSAPFYKDTTVPYTRTVAPYTGFSGSQYNNSRYRKRKTRKASRSNKKTRRH